MDFTEINNCLENLGIRLIQNSEIKKIKIIGTGGYGKVYLSEFQNKNVAVKKLKIQSMNQEEIKSIFNEIQTMKIAKEICPVNIPTFYGIVKGKNSIGLVEEYIGGQSLKEYQKSSTFQQKIDICIQIATILKALHSKNMIHRDLKPDNILISENHIAFLIDFGICRIANRALTKTFQPKGTTVYMSPEQIEVNCPEDEECSFSISTKCDIWSFGIMISEIFSGVEAWSQLAKNQLYISFYILQKTPFPIAENLDENIKLIVQRCTDYEHELRPNAEEIIELLFKLK